MIVLRTATMDLIGLWAECFSGQDRGFMGHTDFTDTSTTGLILDTDTMDRCLIAVRNGSITFRGTKRGMDEVMRARLVTMRGMNTRCLDITVAAAAMLEVTTRAECQGQADVPGAWRMSAWGLGD